MNIIAIDGSTKSTGIAIYKHNKLQQTDCITASSSDLFARIRVMVDNIREILSKNQDIECLVLEQVRPDTFVNSKTYKALMYLQGCIAMMVHQDFRWMEVQFMYPTQWRKVCGIKQGPKIKRDLQKQNDIDWVKQNFGLTVNDDIADAVGIGFAYINK